MLGFIKALYRHYFNIILWINLIVWVIVGGIIGNTSNSYGDNYVIIGVVIGIVIGFISNVIFGGFIATILNIDKNLEEQNVLLNNFSAVDDWSCSKCGKKNRKNSQFCTGCGVKK